jgi:translation initiation factor 5A
LGQKGGEEAAESVPTQAGSIKKGGYCVIKGIPCRVTECSTVHNKVGSVKATIIGNDIFTNKRYEDTFPASASVAVPNVFTKEYEVIDID